MLGLLKFFFYVYFRLYFLQFTHEISHQTMKNDLSLSSGNLVKEKIDSKHMIYHNRKSIYFILGKLVEQKHCISDSSK